MKNKLKVFLTISLIVIIIGCVFAFTAGFNWGTDFKGGIIIRVNMPEDFKTADVEKIVATTGAVCTSVQKEGPSRAYDAAIIIEDTYNAEENEQLVQRIGEDIAASYPGAKVAEYNALGATYPKSIFPAMLLAVGICAVITFLYMLVRQKIGGGLTSIVVPLHDVLLFLALTLIFGFKINIGFIAITLAILVYSAFNTVSLCELNRNFDREFIAKGKDKGEEMKAALCKAAQKRTIVSAVILALVALLMNFLGTPALQNLALPLLIGTVVCAYSALFITLPFQWIFTKNSKRGF